MSTGYTRKYQKQKREAAKAALATASEAFFNHPITQLLGRERMLERAQAIIALPFAKTVKETEPHIRVIMKDLDLLEDLVVAFKARAEKAESELRRRNILLKSQRKYHGGKAA